MGGLARETHRCIESVERVEDRAIEHFFLVRLVRLPSRYGVVRTVMLAVGFDDEFDAQAFGGCGYGVWEFG